MSSLNKGNRLQPVNLNSLLTMDLLDLVNKVIKSALIQTGTLSVLDISDLR